MYLNVNVYLKKIPCLNKVTLPYLTLPYTVIYATNESSNVKGANQNCALPNTIFAVSSNPRAIEHVSFSNVIRMNGKKRLTG